METTTLTLPLQEAFPYGENTTDKQFEQVLKNISIENKDHYITFRVSIRCVYFYLHKRKPQSLNTFGAEQSYKFCHGFYKNGKVIKPSNTFIKKFKFIPSR